MRPLVKERVAGEADLGAADGDDLVWACPWHGARAGFKVGGARRDGAEKPCTVSLKRKPGSGAVSRKVTVPAASLVTMPAERLQLAGCCAHAAAPVMPEK